MGNDSNKNEEQQIKQEQQNNLDLFNDLIIKGKYSDIYKSKNDKNEIIAIKIINKNKISEIINNIKKDDLEKIIQEKYKIMKKCSEKSDYSIKIIDFIDKTTDFYLIMEFCNMNLKDYLIKNKRVKGLKIDKIKEIFTQLNKIFIYMDNNKLYHGDINPHHILITEKDGKIIPKLIDFFNFNLLVKDYTLYTAPEIINNEEGNIKFDIKSDLWSIGLILYELYFNTLPFKSIKELVNMSKNNNKLNILKVDKEKDFNDLIQKLLKINKDERISFNDYIKHNFWSSQAKQTVKITEPNLNIINNLNNNNEDNKEFINKKEIIFEFKTDNLKKELNNFEKKDLKDIEIFKYSGFASKKSGLKDDFIMKWLSKLSFSNLSKIYLNGNDFENIEGLSKLELYTLTDLYLNSNKLSNINELSKMKFENLALLDLSENQINNIESLTKVNFENLSILNLSENAINNISSLGNFNFNCLTILNLGFNQITNIDIFSKVCFTNLTVLFLNNNQIENINVFSNIPFEKLEILNLNNNNIKNIDCLKNAKLKMLKELNLGFNKIEDIKNLNSFPFSKIEILNLSFNKISKITIFEDIKFKSIKKIGLYGNNDINYDSVFVKDVIDELQEKKITII